MEQLPEWVEWVWGSLWILGAVAVTLGSLSAGWPQRSIALYQWIMARCNWRVSPIDAPREIRVTRYLGIGLLGLGGALWHLVMRRGG